SYVRIECRVNLIYISIVGGLVISFEFSTILNAFGSEVTVLEAAEHILPAEDKDVAQAVHKSLSDSGVLIKTGVKLEAEGIDIKKDSVGLVIDGNTEVFDKAVVAIGRKANTEELGLQNTKVKMDHGVIEVNEFQQTSESHIYAIGDRSEEHTSELQSRFDLVC